MTIARRATVAAGVLCLFGAAASARPEYAARESKACETCEVNRAGGGARNPRGMYYAAHSYGFDGYDEAQVTGTAAPKKTGPPAYTEAWKIQVPAASRRIAVADVAGDKRARLLVLGEGGDLTVYRTAPTAIEKEATVDLGPAAGAAKFVVGRFMKGRPAMIAVPGALFYRDGDTYVKKALPDVPDITGMIRFTDGAENFLYFGGGGMPDVWAVDLAATQPLVAGRELVMPDQAAGVYSEMIVHMPPELLAGFGLPEEGTKAGVIGGVDARGDGRFYGYGPWVDKDGTYLVVVPAESLSPLGGGEMKPVWKSPKLVGKVLDVAYGPDPRDGKLPGIYVLHTIGVEDKQREVAFFVLD